MTRGTWLPDFVLAGAMRSGSSSLFRYLNDHPAIFMPAEKELHYFDRGLDRGLDWYRERFQAAAPGQLLGEATPGYLASEDALSRMVETLPDVRVLMVLRDPVSRAYCTPIAAANVAPGRRSRGTGATPRSPSCGTHATRSTSLPWKASCLRNEGWSSASTI